MKFECQRCNDCCERSTVNLIYPDDKEMWKDRLDILKYFSQVYQAPCKFSNNNECLIYDIRPKACRDFPFNENGYKSTCPGVKIK